MTSSAEIVVKDLVNYWSFDPGKMQGKTIQDSLVRQMV